MTAHLMKGSIVMFQKMESLLIVLAVNYEMGMKKYLSIKHVTKSSTISKPREEIKTFSVLRKKKWLMKEAIDQRKYIVAVCHR